jgi:hypothetical protein
MGLDQYLSAKIHLSEYSNKEKCEKVRELFPEVPSSDNLNSVDVEFEVAYWRKANQIHNWFVENVQDGEDDCKKYYVSKEQLKKLVDLCKKVKDVAKLEEGDVLSSTTWVGGKETKNYEKGRVVQNVEEVEQLLPSSSGFFFGGTEYNEWYIRKIEDTITMLEPLLDKDLEFYYQASW